MRRGIENDSEQSHIFGVHSCRCDLSTNGVLRACPEGIRDELLEPDGRESDLCRVWCIANGLCHTGGCQLTVQQYVRVRQQQSWNRNNMVWLR
eukprot:gene21061-biopygen14669